jgi:hypothetical protein
MGLLRRKAARMCTGARRAVKLRPSAWRSYRVEVSFGIAEKGADRMPRARPR